ncbi:Phage P22, antirepressor protein, N-terminal domain-containing protein, partial [Paramagnetospirillum caucaseum]
WAVRRDDRVFVALRPICEALGLAWGSQYNRIRRDSVLAGTVFIMKTVTTTGEKDAVFLPLDYVNGWLFGIQESRIPDPTVRAKVLDYKRECHAVLYRHFFGGAVAVPVEEALPPDDGPGGAEEEIDRSDIGTFIALVRECRSTWGRPAAQRLWRQLPLPQPDGPDISAALTPEQMWWRRRLSDGNLIPGRSGWPPQVRCGDLLDAYVADMRRLNPLRSREGLSCAMAKSLFVMVPGLTRRRHAGDGTARPWVYEVPPLDVCREAFERLTGSPIPPPPC